MNTAKKSFYLRIRIALYGWKVLLSTLVRYGGFRYQCSVCGMRARRFLPHGSKNRPNAKCPLCLSLVRHRLDWIFFRRRTDLFDGSPKRMLHIAPEQFLEDRLKRIPGIDYLSGDLNSKRAMVKMDITNIQYPDNHFSIIYCSHVLEHVPDDRRAIAEFFRVLSPGGWAVLQVPIMAEKTWEDSNITDPAERTRHFGQADHVRACGLDYVERMRTAGFDAAVVQAKDILNKRELMKMNIPEDRVIFFCRKQAMDKAPENLMKQKGERQSA
jgi:SAM-dependent methyltransferase